MDDLVDGWPERVLTMQRNWIGRSEGAYVDFKIDNRTEPVRVFTTRPDTLYGATFFVIAPDAPLAAEVVSDAQRAAFEEYLEQTKHETEIERQATDRPKTGVFLGVHATNPVNGEKIPVYAADYVLAEYVRGRSWQCGHDQRARLRLAFRLPVRVVDTSGPDQVVRHPAPGRHLHQLGSLNA
jgi:leucyl-tRNA synthetase